MCDVLTVSPRGPSPPGSPTAPSGPYNNKQKISNLKWQLWKITTHANKSKILIFLPIVNDLRLGLDLLELLHLHYYQLDPNTHNN